MNKAKVVRASLNVITLLWDDVQYGTYIHIEESEEISSCTRLKDERMRCTAEMQV